MSNLSDAIEDIVEESGGGKDIIADELSDFFGIPVEIAQVQATMSQNRLQIAVDPENFSERLQDEFPDTDIESAGGSFYLNFSVAFE